jgi:hypothetical protein
VATSSFIVADTLLATGASSTALTVRVKVFVSVSAPSVTVTVIVLVPFWFSAGDMERPQFGAVPDFVILALGIRVILEEVTVMELVQFGEESISLNE